MEAVLHKCFFIAVGTIGSFIISLFGGWDALLITLMIAMLADYISGFIVAGVFNNSPKSPNGSLESRAGFKGLCRKGMILLMVLISTQLDHVMGTNFIRNAVVIAYMANELLSIIENLGLMGMYVPPALKKAVDVLKNKGESYE